MIGATAITVHCCSWGTNYQHKSSGTTGPWRFTSAGLNRCTIFSAKTVYARSIWPCRFPSCALLSAPTRPTLEVLFTKPIKDVCLIGIICSHHVREVCMWLNVPLSPSSYICLRPMICMGDNKAFSMLPASFQHGLTFVKRKNPTLAFLIQEEVIHWLFMHASYCSTCIKTKTTGTGFNWWSYNWFQWPPRWSPFCFQWDRGWSLWSKTSYH